VIFTSFQYAGFLAVVVVLNWLLPVRHRVTLLLAASLAFYASWSVPATGILVAVCLLSWGGGLLIERTTGGGRKVLTAVTVLAVASSLFTFKILEAAHGNAGISTELFIPVGLSFFSFQAISYVIDVHRSTLPAIRSPIKVSAFVAFFPHLLAGPIVRANKLVPAFGATPRTPDFTQWSEAAELVLVGVFKKVVIADPVIRAYAPLLLDPDKLHDSSGPYLVLVIASVLVASYFDITGYIDIARGSAKFLGIDMPRNALLPLLRSTGYADFWRRWQLTVMTWFRDYVYQPLRGSARPSPLREHAALFGTFFVLGVWHGLSATWAIWGIASGTIIVIERTLQTRRAERRRAQVRAARKARSKAMLPKPPNRYVSLAIALGLVMVTFPLIMTTDLATSLELYRSLFQLHGSTPTANQLWMSILAVVSVLLLDGREVRREARAGRPDPVNLWRALAFGVMIVAVIVQSGPEPQSFIYISV
jgi:D-alanyl-lipoteichoic acid acyltransferase DltB (MBOAT superfamily)